MGWQANHVVRVFNRSRNLFGVYFVQPMSALIRLKSSEFVIAVEFVFRS
jgi:hypothetical protein